HDVVRGHDLGEVHGGVLPDRVDGADAGERGQVVGLRGVLQPRGEVLVGDVDDLDGDAGLLLVLRGHVREAAALVGVAGEEELQRADVAAVAAAARVVAAGRGEADHGGPGEAAQQDLPAAEDCAHLRASSLRCVRPIALRAGCPECGYRATVAARMRPVNSLSGHSDERSQRWWERAPLTSVLILPPTAGT